jgi:hypothetical protein
MVDLFQSLSRHRADVLWSDIQAAYALALPTGVAQCKPYPPLPAPMP